MARQRSKQNPSENTERVSPFSQISDDYSDDFEDFDEERDDGDESNSRYNARALDDFDDDYDDYDDEDEIYDDEDEYDSGALDAIKGKFALGRKKGGSSGGGNGGNRGGNGILGSIKAFLGTMPGKIVAGAIALLLIVLIALVVVKLFVMPKADDTADQPGSALQTPSPTAQVVFGPADTTGGGDADGNTGAIFMPDGSEVEETATAVPEATATPLPIILTNTPTPSPTPTPEPTPTPTPEPSPTPSPSPTPRVDIATGAANREANLRETATSNGKVKDTVQKGKTVTIHEALYDKDGKIWYALTVDDDAVTGFMRDYVIDVDGEKPMPKEPEEEEEADSGLAPVGDDAETGSGTNGRTNRAANLREAIGGAVLKQLPKGEKIVVISKEKDKSGNLWYNVRTQDGTEGAMRDYVVTLDKDVKIEDKKAEATPAPETADEEDEKTDDGAQAENSAASSGGLENLLDREVIAEATTDRAANVREKPIANATVVRQLSEGVKLHVLAVYEDADGKIWYEVVTTTGKTYGFVRDYVVWTRGLDKDIKPLTYSE